MSASEHVGIAHLDYLQRIHVTADSLTRTSSRTVPQSYRGMWQVRGIGRPEKKSPLAKAVLKESKDRPLNLPSEDVLVGQFGFKMPLALLLEGDGNSVALRVGVWAPPGAREPSEQQTRSWLNVLRAALESLQTFIDLEPASPAMPLYPHGGLALGVPFAKPPEGFDGALPLDRLIQAMSTSSGWGCLVLAEPVDEPYLSALRQSVLAEYRRSHQAAETGQASKPLVEHYQELLKYKLQSVTAGLSIGMWRTAVYLLGDDVSYPRLASLWTGLFSREERRGEAVRTYYHRSIPALARDWAMPDGEGERPPGLYQHPLLYQTLLNSAELAAYVHLPQAEVPGFSVRIVPEFDAVPPRRTDPAPPPVPRDDPPPVVLRLGNIVHRGRVTTNGYGVALDDLTRHAFIAGVTGSGKTNTLFGLLASADELGVPFLVIEPAKAEYRSLLKSARFKDKGKLQVFTLGNETVSPFRMNPFEVVAGAPVGVHLDLLRSAFAASFGMWTPLPQVLERCLHEVYVDRGWDLARNENARLDGRADASGAYPTLFELAVKIDRVVGELGYEDRITGDIRAALLTRVQGLRVGSKGRLLDAPLSFPMEQLLGRPTVIELEDLGDDDDKAFVIALLLIRLVEYRRAQKPSTDGLQHLLVLEEAHRLLSNVNPQARGEEANPRGKAVETFSNLLAEVRAYGQGIMVADQIPTKLAPDVVKNTNLKITHRLVAEDDCRVLAGAMGMDEAQRRALPVLERGRAAVFSEGDDVPVLVQFRDARKKKKEDSAHVTNEQLRKEMERIGLGPNQPWLLPLACCRQLCQAAGPECDAAARMMEDTAVRTAFSRLATSLMEKPDAWAQLWPKVTALAQARRGPRMDGGHLHRCLAVRAAQWWADRRGAQAGWTYEQTARLATALQGFLVARLAGKPAEAELSQFVQQAQALHARAFDPFPECGRICRQDPSVCLYRGAVADLIESRSLLERWKGAQQLDAGTGDTTCKMSLGVCLDAAMEVVEEKSTELLGEQAAPALRRAGLCFGQQMLSQDNSLPRLRAQSFLQLLIKESSNE